MNRKEYNKQRAFKALCKRIKKRFDANERNWDKEVEEINNFIAKHGHVDGEMILWNKDLEASAEGYLFRAAWIYDRLHGYTGFTGGHNYNKSMTKKIRNICGYNG